MIVGCYAYVILYTRYRQLFTQQSQVFKYYEVYVTIFVLVIESNEQNLLVPVYLQLSRFRFLPSLSSSYIFPSISLIISIYFL